MGTIEKYRFATTGYKMLLREVLGHLEARAILGQKTEAWFYSTLNAAVNDVNAGTIGTNEDATEASAVACAFFEDGKPVVGLLKDTTEATRISPSVDMTINLGGHTFSTSDTVAVNLKGNFDLTIDGRLPGSTVLSDGSKGGNARAVQCSSTYNGCLTICGGSYIGNCHGENALATGVYANSGTVNIVGAKISTTSANGEARSIVCGTKNGTTISNCEIVASAKSLAAGVAFDDNVTISNCEIVASSVAGNAYGVLASGISTISNCNIRAYSNYFAEGDTYAANSLGVSNNGTLTINDCCALGTHSGMCNNGTLYVNGGTFEGYGHGGFYFSGDNTTAYVRNATLKDSLTMPDGYEQTAGHNGAGFYIGDSKDGNISVYMDNCDIYGSAASQIFVIKTSNNALYVSNSTINNLKGGDTKIRIDGNNMMYLGIGNNFTAEDTNKPENVIVTNEVYVQEVA